MLSAHLSLEGVVVRLAVLVEVPDVLPVALEHAAVQRAPHLEQEREELLGEVVRSVGGHVTHDFRVEHVDARVDRVGEDLAPRRLLQESLDAAVLVGDHDAELERVVDRLEADRHGGALLQVALNELLEVDVAEGVSRDDEEGLVELVGGEANRPRSAQRRLLDRVGDVDPECVAVAEVAANRLRQERDRDDHVLEAVRTQELEDVLHARLADDRHHRLRLVRGERPESRPFAAGHDDGLHPVVTSRRAFHSVADERREREREADPEEDARPDRALVRDHREREGRVEQPGRRLAEQVDLERVAALHGGLVPDQEQQVTQRNQQRDPRQAARVPEQDRRPCRSEAGRRAGRRSSRTTTRPASGVRDSRRSGR